MAWYPSAIRREIPRFRTAMSPVRVNLHTAVSNAPSLYSYFAEPGRVCSHFYVRQDGTVEQYVDTAYRAAADLEGNPDTISIETWDGWGASWTSGPVPAWTPAQVDSLARLVGWALDTHGIPARLATSSVPGPTSHGVSWHRLGIDPWRKVGGLYYSRSTGKVCPGDARIGQIPAILARTTTPQEDDMLPDEREALMQVRDYLGARGGINTETPNTVGAKVSAILAAQSNPQPVDLDALAAKVASILESSIAGAAQAGARAALADLTLKATP